MCLGADRGSQRGEREPDIFIEGLLAKQRLGLTMRFWFQGNSVPQDGIYRGKQANEKKVSEITAPDNMGGWKLPEVSRAARPAIRMQGRALVLGEPAS